jgi:hypothetical protein
MNHDVGTMEDNEDIKYDALGGDVLLVYMAGQGTDACPGDIRNVLAAKRAPNNGNSHKANEINSTPSIVQVGDTTYFLNKVETIRFQGHQYSAHMKSIH